MRKGVLLATFLLFVVLIQPRSYARPVREPGYRELEQKADVIALLQVKTIEPAAEKPEDYGIARTYSAYTAHCSVVSVWKGLAGEEISLLFFQHPDGRPGFNGVITAPFFEELTRREEERTAYLVYLKKDGTGFAPVTGHMDAGLSIKAIPYFMPLPSSFSVLQPRDGSGEPIGRNDTEPRKARLEQERPE